MKRIAGLLLLAGVLAVLAGCQTDQKKAETIRATLDDAVQLEQQVSTDQKELAAERDQVEAIYEKVLAMKSADTDAIQRLAGSHEVSAEKQQLDAAIKDFQAVHEKIMSIESSIGSIKDDEQKAEAEKLLTLEDGRKKAMDAYFTAYKQQLDTETAFFDQLEQGKFDLKTIDEQVETINGATGKMTDAIDRFNAATKQFNGAQQTYFNMAGLD
ncbi:YkyA family protein [Sporosarcina trichiuri]|uniref:YkyA family protein n=1 Tax=Sporosarcina trichiuri TaxID=3056445 RepID=UPI0025B59788|nr:YkyA family protein [Sporosarcina sp. 0.2-SM1T-5]WJY26334.1 YkyA family protein [Sporosarcina sp. 0.2-SM1T-5]